MMNAFRLMVGALAVYGGIDLAQTLLAGREARLGAGGRNMGSIQEAIMWEESGHPVQQSMDPSRHNRR